ncbi:hypothetical protein KI688_007512 [Linnemannia hyalina]|uniref:Uncharacterized protein n=1 Tax=Linnemannia hyalina TaxID=64524 RepID=A0A9P7XIP3_9FUNG|nr:hypothetical protein KI688_007512 [Linnemannia hyalina]
MAAYTPNTHVQLAGSILRDEYDSINRKITNLQGAHLAALRTLSPLPEDPPLLTSIWLSCQDDLKGYCQNLEQAIKALEAMKMDIVKGLASRTTH